MRFCGKCLLLIGAIAVAGCASASDRQYLEAQREWETLCRAMHHEAPTAATARLSETTRQNLRQAADRARSAVVWISTVRTEDVVSVPPPADGARTSASVGGGSGIAIGTGLVLTNEHVIRNASNLVVELADGRRYCVEQSAIAVRHDLAVLRIACSNLDPLPLSARPAGAQAGVVAVAGHHFPSSTQCRIGVIENTASNLQRQLDPSGRRDYRQLVQTSAEMQPGFSGGPLLDEAGRVIGINVATVGSGEHARGYAIALDDETRTVMDDLCRRVRPLR